MFQPTNIMPSEKIFELCNEIQGFIELPYKSDIGAEVEARATQLEAYMALSGKMLADAKHNLESLLLSEFMKAIETAQKAKLATSTLNKYLDALCKDYSYLVNWCDRLNRACTHGVEFSRTLISKLKAERYSNAA